MSALLTIFGLGPLPGQQAPNHASTLLIANAVLAYLLTSTRFEKIYRGLDHNASPREDLSKYGEAAVQSGKLSRRTLNRLKRQEASHANTVEGYPLFVAAILLSVYAGVPNETVNKIGAWYTMSRLVFHILYSYIETGPASYLRSAVFTLCLISCFTLLVLAGQRL